MEETTLTAFFTGPEIIQPMWQALKNAGYTTGPVLEPGSGTGNFIGYAPQPEHMLGIEQDPVSADIAQLLYPQATVITGSFENQDIAPDSFVAAIGNVPFGLFRLHDPIHNKGSHSIHDHFIVKTLHLVQPGGYVAVITSTHTADKKRSDARKEIIDRADLISAVRLPSQAFKDAGTEVTADILIFRVREPHRAPTSRSQRFLSTETLTLDRQTTVTTNSVFVDTPNAILGDPGLRRDQFGKLVMTVTSSTTNAELQTKLAQHLVNDVAQAQQTGLDFTVTPHANTKLRDLVPESKEKTLPGTIQYHHDDTGEIYFQRLSGITGQWEPIKVPRKAKDEWKRLIDMRDIATALREAYRNKDQPTAVALQGQLATQYDTYHAQYGPLNRFEAPKPKTPSKTQQEATYKELVHEWRLTNGLTPADQPPAEIQATFRDQAANPVVPDTRTQKHLGKLKTDPMIPSLLAFEDFDPKTQTGIKGPLFSGNPSRQTITITHADTIHDAVSISLDRFGVVDPTLVATLLDKPPYEVEETLVTEHLAFRDPDNPDTFIPARHYLSGLVANKLATATQAAIDDPRFLPNVDALRNVQPTPITEGITIRPGVNWLPEELYTQFLTEELGIDPTAFTIVHTQDQWFVEINKNKYSDGNNIDQEWGVIAANNADNTRFNFRSAKPEIQQTPNQGLATTKNNGVVVNALQMFEATLNLQTPTMNWSGTWLEEHPGYSKVHAEATAFADRRVRALQDAFTTWVENNPQRRELVYKIYNETFNSRVAATWDGSHRTMPGLGTAFTPYPYQLAAVERMNNEPAALLNHAVGAGKTGTFLMGAAELKRLGKIRQPWIVVPNHLAEQIAEDALKWYPRATVLSGAGLSSPTERREFIAQTTAQDWDFVIVPRSVFGLIPMSKEQQEVYEQAKEDEIRAQQATLEKTHGEKATSVKKLNALLKQQEARIKDLQSKPRDAGLEFEATHCDYLIVDEAQGYKNLQRFCAVDDLSHPGSQRASDMEMKLNYLRGSKKPNAPIATFATGTPIANNLGELWVMTKYLRPDLLEATNTATITGWAATFTQQSIDVEVKPTGTGLRSVKRSRGYINVGDLAGLCEPFIDTVTSEQINTALPQERKLPTLIGGKNTVIEFDVDDQTRDFMADFTDRLKLMDTKWTLYQQIPAQAFDNVAKMLIDGKKASLDPRLVNLDYDGYAPRVKTVVANIMNVWQTNHQEEYLDEETHQPHPIKGGLQIVFLDRSTPKKDGSYNVYDQLKQALVEQGIAPKQIAFVHEWDHNRSRLFEMCRTGEISILIGSTEKLGTGANIQTRAKALHHMDVPWLPADLEQREGRIIRQGNQNKSIEIFNYIAKATTDAVDWQTLARKIKFINQFWQANRAMRQMEALDSSAEDAAALNKALATGDTRYTDLVNLERKVDELTSQRAEWRAAIDSTRVARIREYETIETYTNLINWAAPLTPRATQWAQTKQSWTLASGPTGHRAQAARTVSENIKVIFATRGQHPLNNTTILSLNGFNFTATFNRARVGIDITIEGLPAGKTPTHDRLQFTIRADDLNFANPAETDKADPAQYGLLSRFEGRAKDFEKIINAATIMKEQAEARYDALTKKANPAFEFEEELAQAVANRDTLRDELRRVDSSEQAQRNRREREGRNAERGRKPGWSLRLVPTKAYAEIIEQTTIEGVIAKAKQEELEALYSHGHITFEELIQKQAPYQRINQEQQDLRTGQALLTEIGLPTNYTPDLKNQAPEHTTPLAIETPHQTEQNTDYEL